MSMAQALHSCDDCNVRHRALCSSLTDTELTALDAIGRRRRLQRGEALVWSGDASTVCANILSGVLKISGSIGDGREQIVGLLYPAEFVGRPYSDIADFTVTAATEVELCVFPRQPFERVLAAHGRMEQLLLRRTLAALDHARARTVMLGRMSAAEKIAGFLIEIAEHVAEDGWQRRGGGSVTFDLPLSRGEMADVLGLTIETVSRQMTRLKLSGQIGLPGGRAVTIFDGRALLARAEAA